MNLAISYSATWQGIAIEALGYPNTLLIDALTGLLCLAVLPFIKPAANPLGDGGGAGPGGPNAREATSRRRQEPVSYTHLDVYKRQVLAFLEHFGLRALTVKLAFETLGEVVSVSYTHLDVYKRQ